MFQATWRDATWQNLNQTWDVIIVGGGITGAGILHEATNAGLRALLIEAKDFASGTSSRSSKMVHGGLRYLKNGQFGLVMESVRERERLLSEGRGLVNPLGFLMANFKGDVIPGWVFGAGLILYDLLALKWGHRAYDAYDMHDLCPILTEEGLEGGYRYFDAQTDDARLVLRIIQEAVQQGASALNYTRVSGLLRRASGEVCGVSIIDQTPGVDGRSAEVQARVVINATGAWADELRQQVGAPQRLRKLRGSHLVLPAQRLPLTRSISFLHPKDGRPVFAFPWEGAVLVGTTDVDHNAPLDLEPAISADEAGYLLQAAQFAFPHQEIDQKDVIATFSGIRPVVHTGKADPSKESREHILWQENGLLTVTGGKLTTFRLMALAALKRIRTRLGKSIQVSDHRILIDSPVPGHGWEKLSPAARMRLLGRYGEKTTELLEAAPADEKLPIGGTASLWAELRWAARREAVVHLDDLLLRRVRIGILLPQGGLDYIERIRTSVQNELAWDDQRWENEVTAYRKQWKRCYHFNA